ncbi:hypothetical protein EB796_015565 [Bugula neritina]|uniref:Uncharacterized protein n=1 Tax=Bugula neritina TaxID=10212 RepID=A0A7J7JIN0_BUGNE|nr:hypothetical protein EB796_015565 [Bugula neritina]
MGYLARESSMDTLFHNLSSFDICQENNIGLHQILFVSKDATKLHTTDSAPILFKGNFPQSMAHHEILGK